MSETKKDHRKRPLSAFVPAAALLATAAILLALLASAEPVVADDQSLTTYGQELCAEAGIAADDCALISGPMPSADAEPSAGGAKTAALIEHASWLCDKQGVPPEDCKALPLAHRTSEKEASPSPFLTAAPTPPGPAAVRADPPPAAQPEARYAQEPRPAGYGGQPIPAPQQGGSYVQEPPPAGYDLQPVPAAQPGARYIQEPPPVYYPAAPLYDEAFPAPTHRRPAWEAQVPTWGVQEPTWGPQEPTWGAQEPTWGGQQEVFYAQRPPVARRIAPAYEEAPPARFRGAEIDRFAGQTARCRRTVRLSRSPPYRYIACD